jgi:hypothetical protein
MAALVFVVVGSRTATAAAQQCQWSPVGSGTSNEVNVLTVFDDGSGPGLYVGGLFTTAGGATTNYIARWSCQ